VGLAQKKGKKVNARSVMALIGLLCAAEVRAHGGLVDLSVYDRTEGRRLAVHWHEGRAYVIGKPGNEYQVTVRNRLRDEVLTVVSVDGVNVISGETANPGQTGYVLNQERAYDILGWRKSLAETVAFYFTTLPDSYAARTGRPDNIGVIGVAVFRRKQAPVSIAPMTRESARDSAAKSRMVQEESRLGTGHGRREASQVQHVAFDRATSAPAETVSLYYDSYRNLLARGIIRDPVPVAALPRPFPGFVPDPQP
jgi:hypothetical protein